jgi:hypothetical protein
MARKQATSGARARLLTEIGDFALHLVAGSVLSVLWPDGLARLMRELWIEARPLRRIVSEQWATARAFVSAYRHVFLK